MKLAKKVLSVVLAVVLALSAFAVVGSANGSPDAPYQAKVWLTGSVGSAKWTSNTAVTITEGDESEAGGTLEVQPGDHVFVRIYATSNYYVHTFQANLFFSSGLLDANEDWQEQRSSTKTIGNSALKKIHPWNFDHPWVSIQGESFSNRNCWSFQAMEGFNDDVEQNWPTDDEGNNLFNMADWKFNRLNNLASDQTEETCIWDDEDNHIIMMTFKVPETAEAGDTFYVTIPEGTEQRENKVKGALRLWENGICADCDEPCEVVDTQASLNPNMQYGDDLLYWDLSEATITLQVPGEAGVDTAELEAKLEEAADLLDDGLTADSIAALNAAIEQGTAALTSNDQATVNAAVTALTAAINGKAYLADFSALNEQISRYDALDADAYDATSFANATAKYDDAMAIDQKNEADQDKVDAATAALKDAIDNLAAALDYSKLLAKVEEVKDTDTSIYTDETAGAFNAALATAQSLVATTQGEIDKALADLTAAFEALAEKDADYTALDKAIEDFEALDEKAWTPDSYAAAKTAYDAAKAVARDLKITAQATVTSAADELNAKLGALVAAGAADYTALDKAIADAKALVADNYVSFADVTAALAVAEAVDRNLTANDQATIDAATDALVAAMGALVEADADYSAVTAAQSKAQAILDKKDGGVNSYSDETLAAVNEALAAVETGLKKKDQDKVDAMADAIEAAVANAKFRPWDYQPILDHIAAIEAKGEKYYDADSYAAYLAKKDALVWDYTYEQYAKAMLQQINFLKVTVEAAAAADYAELDAAIAEAEALDADNYEDFSGVEAALADAKAVARDLTVNDQKIIDDAADALNAAIDALVEIVIEPADYTALDKAIADAKALVADEYVSFADVEAALADAEAVARNLTVDEQATVNAAADALVEAMAALEKKADYSALDAAILRAGTYDKNAWTDATWAVVEEKLAAANAVARNLGVSAQGKIDAAAEALNVALDKLEAKEVVSSISTITYTPADDTHNTFDVVVNGRMAMVQFIEEDGGTRTYDRYNKNVTIKSYNAEGVEVNSLDRSVAYEVWTINTNLVGPNVEVRTKYLSGNQYIWETERYAFTLQFVEPTIDAEVRSITPAATAGKKGPVTTVVVVGPDAQGVRFVMENGTTTTYSADKAVVLENGDLEFTGKAWMNEDGLNSIMVKVKVNGVWETVGCVEYTVE